MFQQLFICVGVTHQLFVRRLLRRSRAFIHLVGLFLLILLSCWCGFLLFSLILKLGGGCCCFFASLRCNYCFMFRVGGSKSVLFANFDELLVTVFRLTTFSFDQLFIYLSRARLSFYRGLYFFILNRVLFMRIN